MKNFISNIWKRVKGKIWNKKIGKIEDAVTKEDIKEKMSDGNIIIDDDIKKRLVYTKRLFLIGKNHESLDTEIDRLVAITLYDDTIEHILNIILSYFEYHLEEDRPEKFFTIWKRVNSALDENKDKIGKFKLPNARDIKQLHEARNGAKHHGNIPSPELIQRSRIKVENFMKVVIEKVFDIKYSQISLGLLIKNIDAKKFVTDAENHLLNGEYEKSIESSAIAFYIAKAEELKILINTGSLEEFITENIDPDPKDVSLDYVPTLSHILLHEIIDLKLGLHYKIYGNFRRISPDIHIHNGKTNIRWHKDKGCSHKNALFCLNFVMDSVSKWESFKMDDAYTDKFEDYSGTIDDLM